LKDLGHTVFEAGDAHEALAVLGQQAIDVLITDIGLPSISGSDLALQARRRNSSLKVIFASGRNAVAIADADGLLKDAIELVKPYSARDLAAALAAATR